MMGIVAQKDVTSGCHTDNVNQYVVLVVLKMGLDATVLYMCCRKRYTSFLNMCSLSMVLADFVMVLAFSIVLFLGPDRYLMSLCFVLGHASAMYKALPLPMICMVLSDYCLEATRLGKQSARLKILRHTASILLVWILAVIYSFGSVKSDLIKMDFLEGLSALVCEVQESTLISYFTLGLFLAVICSMLPFWSMIPQWVREADRLSVGREKRENQRDLWSTPTNCKCMETKGIEEKPMEETIYSPPLWFSIILGFSLFWMPYLTVSVVGILMDFGVPAYITVNLLWLECTNSFLTGVMFWAKSNTEGPYRLPENVCDWPIYWHLSKGSQQQMFSPAVFDPSNEKRHILLCV
ncbi:probable G-protein coupled receptor 160 [Clinocottus analis]|uniref:probable G-protein coupled receptor 160 n=1 Tax=Clinocottus analis TaxID=304258 RepID=UPI0035BFC565